MRKNYISYILNFDRYKVFLLYLISSALLLLFQLPTLNYPGVGLDEVMWINVALNTNDPNFLYSKIAGWPFMLMPYVGAFKGYIYKLIFSIFEPSVLSLRIPTILIAGLGLGSLAHAFLLIRKQFGALVVLAYLLLSPLTGLHAQFDLGPSAIEFTIRCLIFCLFIMYLKSRSKRILFFLFLLFVIGIWNKLSFIWFVNSLSVILILVFLLNIRNKSSVKHTKPLHEPYRLLDYYFRDICAHPLLYYLIFSYLFFCTLFYRYIIKTNYFVSTGEYAIKTKINYIEGLITGTSYYNSVWDSLSNPLFKVTFVLSLFFFSISFFRAIYDFVGAWSNRTKFFDGEIFPVINLACVLTFLTMLLQILLTSAPPRSWHAYTLFPALPLAICNGFIIAHKSLNNDDSHFLSAKKTVLGAAVFIIFLSFITLRWQIITNMGKPQVKSNSFHRIMNTNVTNDLFKWLKEQEAIVYFLDWGFQTQAIFFDSQKQGKYPSVFGYNTLDSFLATNFLATTKETELFVTHSPIATAFPELRDSLFSIANKTKTNLCSEMTFKDGAGVIIVEVWKKCAYPK